MSSNLHGPAEDVAQRTEGLRALAAAERPLHGQLVDGLALRPGGRLLERRAAEEVRDQRVRVATGVEQEQVALPHDAAQPAVGQEAGELDAVRRRDELVGVAGDDER